LLGMIVGVTAFVTVVSLIQGFNVYIDEKIAGIGAKSFSIQRFNPFEDFKDTDTIAAAQRRNKELTLDDYEYLKKRRRSSTSSAPKPAARRRKSNAETSYSKMFSLSAPLQHSDIDNRNIEIRTLLQRCRSRRFARVAYIGADIATNFSSRGQSRSTGEIYVRGLPYRVLGVEAVKGTVSSEFRRIMFCGDSAKYVSTRLRPVGAATFDVFHATSKSDDSFH
jgi:hypothetical protein